MVYRNSYLAYNTLLAYFYDFSYFTQLLPWQHWSFEEKASSTSSRYVESIMTSDSEVRVLFAFRSHAKPNTLNLLEVATNISLQINHLKDDFMFCPHQSILVQLKKTILRNRLNLKLLNYVINHTTMDCTLVFLLFQVASSVKPNSTTLLRPYNNLLSLVIY